ncbi:INO80 complex subunit B [Coemansia sp. RSA 1807]|nr:INO80 complex subunit B [Coemansia sp. RSA 2167]KAJ2132618.1 INO80 complex subunit B [Coemansia sp. RSA 921]KAJ2144394.1 INO80 complex subunit B [Coemansia sp. RSA 564]KAJ2270933.1 INO80 complex subunit B [Coemansia sp. RSA 451]KAJ2574712.1 INO80 complex subunit B [Coemansia sp. RSA 1807]KAJ2715733.1 INO80 complex subunit B [Coemansia sp. D1744]
MAPKRKIANEDSTPPSSTESDASEAETASTRNTRTRRLDNNPQSSPALNTRRSSRLSATAEEPAKPRARLTRGLRRESNAAANPVPARGRGRGRGRGRPRGSGRGGARRGAAAGTGRGRGRPRIGESDVPSESESDQDAEQAEEYATVDKSESDNATPRLQTEDVSEQSDESEGLDQDGAGANQDDVSDAEPVPPPKKRRGRPPASESRASKVISDEEPELDLDALSDLSESEFGLGLTPTANLTRRQRAKLNNENGEELMELPVEAKRSKFSAEEAALRKSEHARRRKFQSLQRAEQLKNDTINRLLNKQTSKGRNRVGDDGETRANSVESSHDPDTVRYIQRSNHVESNGVDSTTPVHIECALLLPNGTAIADLFPGAASTLAYPLPAPLCAVAGCEMKKKYAVESQPACSLEHWRLLKESASAKLP